MKMKNTANKKPVEEITSDKKIKRRNFISFAAFIGLYGAAYGGWKWLYNSAPEEAGVTAGARKPLRRALNQTELFLEEHSAIITWCEHTLNPWLQKR